MRVIILAAGEGKRIRSLTDSPKCLLKINGEAIIDRTLRILKKHCCTPEIVVGYEFYRIKSHLGKQKYIFNPLWNKSNTLISLAFAIAENTDDALVINGDLLFRENLIEKMLSERHSSCAVQYLNDPTAEEVKVAIGKTLSARRFVVTQIGKNVDSSLEAVGAYLFGSEILRSIRKTMVHLERVNELYYEDALNLCLGHTLVPIYTENAIEVDTPEDYDRARDLYED